MGVIPETFRHPEWKRLYDAMLPLLPTKREYSYEELSALCGMDSTSQKGRAQCLRCFREIRKIHRLHFENVRREGYRIIQPDETPASMTRQNKLAGRRLRYALDIGVNARHEEMKKDVSAEVLRRVSVQGALIQGLRKSQREDRKQIAAIESRLAIVEAIVKH